MKSQKAKATAKSSDAKRVQILATMGIELMREERQTILDGDFAKLADLRKRKVTLMDDIEARFETLEGAPRTRDHERDKQLLASAISLLSRRADENLRLLESARSGAESGMKIFASVRLSNPAEIGLYSAQGARIATSHDASSTSRKL